MTPPELPYDVLLRIFSNVVTLRDDRIKGETSSWLLSSTSVDLLSCSLVARSWRLPAQQSLWRGVKLYKITTAELFLRTAMSRPDLARQTRLLVFRRDDKLLGTANEGRDSLILASLYLPILIACPNVRTVDSKWMDDSLRPAFEAALTTMQHLETWCARPSIDTISALLQSSHSLRRLEINNLGEDERVTPSLLSLPLPPPPLFALYIHARSPAVALSLISAVGTTLRHLSIYSERAFDPETTLSSLRSTTSSLQRLSLHLNDANYSGSQDLLPIEDLLPEFSVLERLAFTTDIVSTAEVVWRAPPSLQRIEITDYADSAGPFLHDIIKSIPSRTQPHFLRQLALYCDEATSQVDPDVISRATAAFQPKAIELSVRFDSSSPSKDFFEDA